MDNIQSFTCVKFFNGTTESGHYINITTNATDGCQADVGFLSEPGQKLNLAPRCMNKGGALHEIMHALGFQHEHQVPWRDKFIKVNMKNLRPKSLPSFWKLNDSQVLYLGYEYDYDSVMHYGPYQSSFTQKKVIIALQPGAENMGFLLRLSHTDIYKINTVYDCPEPYSRGPSPTPTSPV